MDKRVMYAEKKAPIAEERGHICVCLGISKDTIVTAVEGGAKSFEEVKQCTSAGLGCSFCEPIIEDIISEA